MWLKNFAYGQLLVVLLLNQCNVMLASASNNIAQLKNKQQQQPLVQETTATSLTQQQQQKQQHLPHVRLQTQHHRNIPSQPVIAAHPTNNDNGDNALHDSTQALTSSGLTLSYKPPASQYVVNDNKEAVIQEVLKRFQTDDDSYQMLNEFKREAEAEANTNHHQTMTASPQPSLLSSPPSANSAPYSWNLYDRPYTSIQPAMAGLLPNMFNPFETISSSYPVTPRFLPIMTYPQPIYVPYPFVMPPDMFYPDFLPIASHITDNYEDSISRGAATSRRPASNQHPSSFSRNSPIYYVRLPPTPYMFLPSLGLGNPSTGIPGYPSMLPYQSLPSFPSIPSILNVPINFLANGKPSSIYQMSAPPTNEMQNPSPFANVPSSFNTRPPPPPPPNHYRPTGFSTNSYLNPHWSTTSSSNYGASSSSSLPGLKLPSPNSAQDSRLTALKRPYYFNGRPEEIYVLPNNFNALYSSTENTYY